MTAAPATPPPPIPPSPLGRLAGAIARRRAVVIGIWVATLIAVVALAPRIAGEWSANYATPGSDSNTAEELLDARFPERSANTLDVVWQTTAGTSAAAADRQMNTVLAELQGLERVGDGVTAAAAERSPDGRTAVVRVPLEDRPANVAEASGEELVAIAERGAGAGASTWRWAGRSWRSPSRVRSPRRASACCWRS